MGESSDDEDAVNIIKNAKSLTKDEVQSMLDSNDPLLYKVICFFYFFI